jgi:hypothetical protein
MLGDQTRELHTSFRNMHVPGAHRRRDAKLVQDRLKSLRLVVDISIHTGYLAHSADKDGHSPSSG